MTDISPEAVEREIAVACIADTPLAAMLRALRTALTAKEAELAVTRQFWSNDLNRCDEFEEGWLTEIRKTRQLEAQLLQARNAGLEEAAKRADRFAASYLSEAGESDGAVYSACCKDAAEVLAFIAKDIRALMTAPAPDQNARELAHFAPTHQHYKGGLYQKLFDGFHSETQEALTVYRNAEGTVWVRPKAMFDEIMPDGRPRFNAKDHPHD